MRARPPGNQHRAWRHALGRRYLRLGSKLLGLGLAMAALP